MTITQELTSTLAPPRCVLCGGAGQRGDEPWGLDLCGYCEAACRAAGSPGVDDPEAGVAGVGVPAGLNAVRALYSYEDPVDQLVTALKFHGDLACGRVMGILLARHLRAQAVRLPQALVPMPLHVERYRERGFNQAAVIATHVAWRTGIEVAPLLQRVRATAPQTSLDASARRRNCEGAFAVPAGRPVPGRVALLDDVMTTGSTAAAAAQALLAAGARHVELWVCAVAQRADALAPCSPAPG